MSELATFGLRSAECRELARRGFVTAVQASGSRVDARSRLILTNIGLVFLQRAIPAGALRPVYDIPARELSVAGRVVVRLAVQARSQAAILAALEVSGWKPRVAEPLGKRPGGNDSRHLAAAAHHLSLHQPLIDFHADDGAATWNWRLAIPKQQPGKRRTVIEL